MLFHIKRPIGFALSIYWYSAVPLGFSEIVVLVLRSTFSQNKKFPSLSSTRKSQ